MANLQFPIYQKSLCEDLKKTFLKRSTDTDSTRGAEEVVSEVSDMLSTDIAVYAEKLLKEMSGSSLEGLDRILRSKLDVDVFSELFTALDSSGIPVDLSDKDAVSRIATIRANYGFWGVDFISALGKSTGGDIGDIGGGSGVEALYELVDVKPNASGNGVLGAKEGTALVYNGTYWVAGEAGLSETQLSSYLTTNEYVTKSNVYTKDDVYTKKEVDDLLAALKFFEKVNVGTDDSPRYALHILESMGLYSDDFISALGKSTTGGTGGGGVSYERLDSWEVYDETKSEWVLSAGLGYSLRTDIALLVNRLDTLEGKNIYWSDIKNTPSTLKGYGIADAYTKSEVDELVLFEKVNIGTEENPVWAIHAKDGMGIYSDKFISALGVSSIGDTTGLYERLDSWDSYSSERAEWVLSAYLGNDLNSRVKALEYLKSGHKIVVEGNGSIITNVEENVDTLTFSKGDLSFSKVVDKPNTLKGYGITDGVNSFEISGEGNAFTGCNIDGHKIIFTKGETFLPRATFDELFEKVNIGTQETPIYAIRAKYGFYSDYFVSAMGTNNGAGSPGLSYERLDNWSDYTEDKSEWVLSAALGYSLNTRVIALEELKKGHTISINGSGNVVTNVSENGNTLTFTKSDLSFAKIIEKPTTIAGYGITDAKISNGVITLGGSTIKPLTAESNLAWGKITGTPTTLSGYGITDGVNAYSVSGAGNAFTGVSISGHTITFTKGGTFLPKATFDDLFEKVNVGTTDSPVYAIRAKYGLYSDSFITAMGYGSSSTGVFDRLDNWDDYDDVKATWVLSAYLGNTLNERVSYLESNPQGHTIVINGSGNVLTNVVESGSKLTFTKGEIIWSKIKDVPLGTANGLATLDASGKVPSSQLPSYVDDVLECINKASFPTTGESGKIYIDQTTNLTYRWGGSTYVEISQSLALGETSSTAYAGDKGKQNAADIAALKTGKADKSTTLAGYGITDAYTKTEVNTKLTDGSVTKIGTKDVGSATLPIYLKAGVPTACNTTLGVSITGNSATATKLANARTLWGQSFDGSANVSGNMTGVGTITPTGEDLKVVGNLIVTGGIVMYADDGATIESGFAALLAAHIDGVTIKYNEAQQKIYSVMTGIKVNGTTYKPSETDGYITIPDYPTSLDWENIENKPSSFTPARHTHTFASLTSKPTTLSGYGITDAKIANGVITLGTATITPLIAHQTVTLASGTNNGTLKLTVGSKTTDNIAVKGLGSAAYTASSAYAAASHTHSQYLVASSLDGYVNALTDNTSTNVFVTAISKSGKTLSYTKSFTKKSLTAASHSGWSSADTDKLIIPDMSFIAYWNGAYNSSGNSNLVYCNKGAFGDMATASKSSYYTKTEVGTKLTDGSVTKLGTATVGSGTQHFYLNAGTATASTSTVGGTAKPMYLNAGVMTAISDTVGGTAKPIFLNAGTLTAISATVGSVSKPVYLSGGSITACSYDFTSYLPLSGGTMGGTAWIVWPDSGNWDNSNSGVTFPVTRGGLHWVGQSDWVKLYSQETGGDNLNLVLQFGDDNSNGLSIRNSGGSQTAFISATGHITAANTTVNGTLKVGAIPVTNSSTGVLKIDGNLIVTGGITMYATDGVASGLMEQILVDGTTIKKKADGTLYADVSVIGGGTVKGATVGGTAVTLDSATGILQFPAYPTATNKAATLAWNTTSTIATVAGTDITVKLPANPNTDTKNTAGSTDTSSKIFLIGATSQAANPKTYSHDTAYVGTDGCLYSGGTKVSVSGHTHSYLPLSGGTMTGVITLTSGSNAAYDKTALSFIKSSDKSEQARIGTDGGSGLGLYATGSIYIRPNVTLGSGSTNGLIISSSSFTYNGTAVSLVGHTHSYLPLSGGTMTGDILAKTIQGVGNSNRLIYRHLDGQNCNGNYDLYLQYHQKSSIIYLNGETYKIYNKGANYNGNAATATALSSVIANDKLPERLREVTTSYSGRDANTIPSNGFYYCTSNINGLDDANVLQLAYDNSSWRHQLMFKFGGTTGTGTGYDGKDLWTRLYNDNSKTWTEWYRILTSGNFNAYSPKLDGTGASGTWGISIKGNASTATKLTSSAGSATLPIYFSDGKPVACTASSVFSNLSNSGNNISVTVAGQNRTLTVGYASNSDTVDGEHASNFSYTHQPSFDFSKRKSGRIVTFDQQGTNYGWINGFASTHNDYLTSIIFNTHRTANWYVGYIEGDKSTGETKGLTAVKQLAFLDSKVADSDKLDGVHADGLLTALSNSNNGVSITVGGTTKSVSNISVNYASSAGSAGNADKVDGYHATDGRTFNGNINWSGNWNDAWSDGTNKHPWYGFDHRYPNTGAYSTTITDYFGMTVKTAGTLRLDFNTLLLNGTSIYSINVASASKWATARKITLSGSVTGSVYIDGSGDVTLATTTNHTHSYLPLSGGTMTGTLTTVTAGTHEYNQGIRINRTATNQWATLLIGKSGTATSGTGTSTAGDGAWLIATPASSNSLIFNLNSASEAVGLCLKGHGASDMKWNNNTVLHAGNFNSYSPKLDGTGASGTWAISVSGNAATASAVKDLTNGRTTYLDYGEAGVTSPSWLCAWNTRSDSTYEIRAISPANMLSVIKALPLAGGTMTAGARISHADGNMYIGRSDNNGWVMCQDMCSQSSAGDSYWSLRTDGVLHAVSGVFSSGLTTSGNITVSGTVDIGSVSSSVRYIYGVGLWSGSGSALTLGANDTNMMRFLTNGNVGIGTASPSQKLHVSGKVQSEGLLLVSGADAKIVIDNTDNDTYWSYIDFRQKGTTYGTFGTRGSKTLQWTGGDFLVSGGITMYSDLRKKNILSDEVLSVKEIAAAPLFRHTYKGDDNQYIHVGTSAQYWSGIHEDWFTRKDSEGYYQMELQNLGVAMGISLAREIVKYESKTDKKIRLMRKKINDLEARIKELEERRTA